MPLFLIEISWTRRVPDPEQDPDGTTTYAEYARSAAAATTKAVGKFNRHYGMHRAIRATREKPDPGGIFNGSTPAPPSLPVHDCGSGHHFGICPRCRHAHGWIVFSASSPITAH